MDLRIKKTQSSIVNAFLQLRAAKPLEKITVKELSDIAVINKATFYSHYKDIYDLSERLENEAVDKMLDDVAHPEYFLTKPKEAVTELINSIAIQGKLFDTLFSGTGQMRLLELLEKKLKVKLSSFNPDWKNSLEVDLALSVLIQGSFYAFLSHRDCDFDEVIEILGRINDCMFKGFIELNR